MASPDLQNSRSLVKRKITLPTQVEIFTAEDSYSRSSSFSGDSDSSTADSPNICSSQKSAAHSSSSVQNLPKRNILSGRSDTKSLTESERAKLDDRFDPFRSSLGYRVDSKLLADAEANWARLQIARAQLANNLGVGSQRTNDPKTRFLDASINSNASRRLSEKNLPDSNEPHFNLPGAYSKSKQKRQTGDSRSSRVPQADGEAVQGSPSTMNAPVRLWQADSMGPSTLPVAAPRGYDRSSVPPRFERHIREQLDSAVAFTNRSVVVGPTGNLRSTLSPSQLPRPGPIPAPLGTSNSNSGLHGNATPVASSRNGVVVEQLFDHSRENSDLNGLPASQPQGQLSRPTIRRPQLAALPNAFSSARTLLNTEALGTSPVTVRQPNETQRKSDMPFKVLQRADAEPNLMIDNDFLSTEPMNAIGGRSTVTDRSAWSREWRPPEVVRQKAVSQQTGDTVASSQRLSAHENKTSVNGAPLVGVARETSPTFADSGIDTVVSNAISNIRHNLRVQQANAGGAAASSSASNQQLHGSEWSANSHGSSGASADTTQSSGYQSAATTASASATTKSVGAAASNASASDTNTLSSNANVSTASVANMYLTEYHNQGVSVPVPVGPAKKPTLPSLTSRSSDDKPKKTSKTRNRRLETTDSYSDEDAINEDEMSDIGRDQDDAGAAELDDAHSLRSVASEKQKQQVDTKSNTATRRGSQSLAVPTNSESRAKVGRRSLEDESTQPEGNSDGKLSSAHSLDTKLVMNGNEQPVLITSLFAYMPVVIRFVPEGEKVEKPAWEIRKVLNWRVSNITPIVVKKCVARSGFRITKKAHEWLGCFGRHMRTEGFKAIRRYQKFNHFPGSFQIGRKDRLWRNLHRMQSIFGRLKGDFDFVPETYILPEDYDAAKAKWEEQENTALKPIFIMKPPAAARGRGVKVVRKWADVSKKKALVVQNYIRNPFLINGYKFDLRIYVYVSSIDPLRIYVYRDGLVRFASARFSLQDKALKNRYAHLTNYSINSQNKDYRPSKDSNNNADEETVDGIGQSHKWSLKAFWSYMQRKNVRCDSLWSDIKSIVVKTILSAEAAMNSAIKANVKRRYCVHELFGFDILVDSAMKPWLLECNISPSLHSDSPLDVRVKSHMVADMFNLAGFQIPDIRTIKPLRGKYALRYQVDGEDLDEYQAMFVSAPETMNANGSTSVQPNALLNTGNNAKDAEEDEISSDSSSESDDDEDEDDDDDEEDESEENEKPYYITDKRLATRKLTPNERSKHSFYCHNHQNEKIMETILHRLTPDDIYVLCETLDELNRVGDFDVAFPTADSAAFFRYFEQPRYYNLLIVNFLKKFNTNSKREQAIGQLASLCKKKIHLCTNISPNSEHFWVSPQQQTRT